jgi:O-antigen/teichoic acid export membrane protein
MNFLKVGLTFAVSTGTKLVAGLFIVKVIALYVGAEGLGQLGQFMSVMNMVTTLAGGGIVTGLIKYVAEHAENKEELSRYLSSGSFITLMASGLIALILIAGATPVSNLLLGTPRYVVVFYVLALVQFIIGANNYATSVINGHRDAKGFAIVSASGTLVGAVIMFSATRWGGLTGSMYGLMLMPAAMAFFSIPYIFYRGLISATVLAPRRHSEATNNLLHYSGMLCVTVSTLPVAQIVVRNLIEKQAGWGAVGYWQGVSRISDVYLQFITVVLSNYYLPQLSAISDKDELRSHVYNALKIAVPATVLMALTVFLLRDLIIPLLFSKSFLPMRDLFLFQLIGDCFKVSAYTIGYVCVAKAMTRLYIFAEIYQSVMFIVLANVFLNSAGPVGVTYAYALNYALYFVIALVAFRRYVSR